MQNSIMELVERSSMKDTVPQFDIGDTVDVHVRILEGEKERIQIFNGVVIAKSGSKTREMFTVRRIVQGEGVERKFPLHSPRIADIVVKRSGKVRRAKLYYLRQRSGKAVRLKERFSSAASAGWLWRTAIISGVATSISARRVHISITATSRASRPNMFGSG